MRESDEGRDCVVNISHTRSVNACQQLAIRNKEIMTGFRFEN